jgi:cellulose synthase (UDP-forming)
MKPSSFTSTVAAAPSSLSQSRPRDTEAKRDTETKNVIHSVTNVARELRLTSYCIAVSLPVMALAMYGLVHLVVNRLIGAHFKLAAADALFVIAVAFLMWGTLFYQITRWAYYKRMTAHRPLSREDLEAVYQVEHPHPLAILIPSYKEEVRVVRMTLMSAALTEYPDRRVVLLIDDPPNPSTPQDAKDLAATRALVRELDAMFRGRQRRYGSELEGFKKRVAAGTVSHAGEYRRLARLYCEVAAWLESRGASYPKNDHYDDLYVKRVLLEPAAAHRRRAKELHALASQPATASSRSRFHREYRRLAALFAVPIESFERKRYVNLSHAANKAMNLNSYMGLFGRNFREVIRSGALHLEECTTEPGQIHVRDVDYIITLDADSMLLNDYALKLTHIMDKPESARFAVVQSPFSAVPNSPTMLERVAGAQTDLQWFGTQGATFFNSSFWVGANALLRRSALEDICEVAKERGYPIRRYIHDRTLVEDTESTIDLVIRGWKIYCYPERLSYSATPRDFGALVIQRRRWANGPLLIVPNLIRYASTGSDRLQRLPESLIRLNMLTSVVAAASMLMTIAIPFPDAKRLPVIWLMFSAIPYYVVYCRDFEICRYNWWDLPRTYALNLLLITVNLTGMAKSFRQALTGARSEFTRTPKVPGRTAAPLSQIIMPLLIVPCVTLSSIRVMAHSGWAYGSYGILNLFCLLYALYTYVGPRAGYEDICGSIALRFRWQAALTRRLRRELPTADVQTPSEIAGLNDRVSV